MSSRLSWTKFGEAAKGIKCTHIADDVEIEFVTKKVKESDYKPNGYWIMFARKQGWSDSDIKDIMRAADPTSVALKMYERVLATEKAILKQDLEKRMLLYEQQREAAMEPPPGIGTPEPAATDVKPSPGAGAPESVPAAGAPSSAPSKPTGLRARFSSKQAENQQADSARALEPKTGGIASRLKQMKQVTETNEQDSTLFVRNVPEDYNEQDIKAVLGDRFNVSRINVVRKMQSNGERASTGSAFIVLSTREDAVDCMEYLQGYRWCNIIASVDFSQPKKATY